jgi:transcriptional regulatory protein LEU3
MGLECRILPTSTRNLRQTKAEMRRELEELRWNMRQNPGSNPDGQNSAFTSPMDRAGSYSNPQSAEVTDGSASLSPAPHFEGGGSRKSSHGHTLNRALDGYMVDAKRIDDCFSLYVSLPSYAPASLM